MRLRTRALVAFNMVILAMVICVAILMYVTANRGLNTALEMKAHTDVHQALELIDAKYPGPWDVRNNVLYKGHVKVTGNYEMVDMLKMVNEDHVTIFLGDTRVTTSFVGNDGVRPVHTKASADVVKQVLGKQKEYIGYAEVLGSQYLCAYIPLYSVGDHPVGMLFVGIPTEKVEIAQDAFIRVAMDALIAMVAVVIAVAWMAINWMLQTSNVNKG